MPLPDEATNAELNNFLFKVIDKASPYYLAEHDETKTLSSISDMTFAQLQIPDQAIALMWLGINAYAPSYGAKPIPPNEMGNIDNVHDLVAAVYATMQK